MPYHHPQLTQTGFDLIDYDYRWLDIEFSVLR